MLNAENELDITMDKFEVEFYTKDSGEKPAKDFFLGLDAKMRAKVLGIINVLEEKENQLREPYSKHLDDGIFEIRGKVGTDITRVLYFFYYGKWKEDHNNKWIRIETKSVGAASKMKDLTSAGVKSYSVTEGKIDSEDDKIELTRQMEIIKDLIMGIGSI